MNAMNEQHETKKPKTTSVLGAIFGLAAAVPN